MMLTLNGVNENNKIRENYSVGGWENKKKEEEEIQRLANFNNEWIMKHTKFDGVACFDPVW